MKAEKILPEWIHSHYADAGYVAAELSAHLHVPFVHSAHSLGIPKLEKLLDAGVPRQESFQKYQFERRFEAEESVLANSEFVVTSTEREVGLFSDYSNSEYAEYHVLPPGIDSGRFYPYYEGVPDGRLRSDDEKQAVQMAGERIARFLNDPSKPLILAVCRPDKRKNIDGLLHAYGTDL